MYVKVERFRLDDSAMGIIDVETSSPTKRSLEDKAEAEGHFETTSHSSLPAQVEEQFEWREIFRGLSFLILRRDDQAYGFCSKGYGKFKYGSQGSLTLGLSSAYIHTLYFCTSLPYSVFKH